MPPASDASFDVFISYAHYDAIPDREGEKGWVESFDDQLSTMLLKKTGVEVKVWRDPELRRAELFDAAIREAIEGSRVLVALLSKRFLNSDYCRKELDCFSKKAAEEPHGLVVGNTLRIFPVLMWGDIPFDDWPEVCHGASGFTFYGDDDYPLNPTTDAFQTELKRLVSDLEGLLEKLRGQTFEAEHAGATVAEPRETSKIFLACAADDMRQTGRVLVSALDERNVKVASGIPPPHDDAAHAAAVTKALGDVDLCVSLLGTSPGEPLESERATTYVMEQTRLAMEHDCPQLIIKPELFDIANVADPAYREFLQQLDQENRETSALEVVQAGRRETVTEVVDKLERLAEAARVEARKLCDRQSFFIDLQDRDISVSADLVQFLAQREITPLVIPSDFSSSMESFAKFLTRASRFVTVFGNSDREWVDGRLQVALKEIVALGLPFRPVVYVAPPPKSEKDLQFGDLYKVIDNSGGFDEDSILPLLT